uniref:Ig-like, group 1 n=1 Tax=Geobacter sp. (strain M21) TaxID=443144 RepID=C6E0S5_GEOSM
MIFLRHIRRLTFFLGTMFLMYGCSGGGGSSSGAGPTVAGGTSTVTLSIVDPSLELTGNTTATAIFRKIDGSAAANIPVTFATTLGTVTPASGLVTDANGAATITLTAGSTSGEGQLSASATVENRLVTSTALFSVNLPALQLTNLSFTNNATNNINYGSTQAITVEVRDMAGNLYTAQPVDVVFTSLGSAAGTSLLSSPVRTVNGIATTTYTANTFSGTDTISAAISGFTLNKQLNVIPLSAGSIKYVSASPAIIGLRGMGGFGFQETSRVTFQVFDTSSAPKANQPVTFTLSTTQGGLTLSSTTGSTGADGTVSTIVQSGIITTPVVVIASTNVDGTTLTTQSAQLTVSTGLPSQDQFSLSVANMNPEAYNVDGVTTTVTARLADHFGNPVADGTAVVFTTSGGSIQPSCVTTGGVCSVTWTSQNPRPAGAPGGPALRTGRAVVLARAIGEESFVDLNGNGLADTTDTLHDDPEAFRDDNENGLRDAGEPFNDFNVNGSYDAADTFYNGIFQGTAGGGAATSKDVFDNLVIVMATSAADITTSIGSIAVPTSFTVTVKDTNGNTMPSGTTITTTAPFGVLSGNTNYTVPQKIDSGDTLVFRIDASDSASAQSGQISIVVKTPQGLQTTRFIPIAGNF